MESDEFRTVRVYTKKYTSKDKDGNTVEKESQQKQVSLKKEDPFEDDDLVKVLAQKDYEKLMDNQFSDAKLDEFKHTIEAKDAEIATLENQIQTLKASFFDDVDSLKEKGMGDVPDAPFRNTYTNMFLRDFSVWQQKKVMTQ